MLSRVADAIYWMSRYVERAENVARFLDVSSHLMLDLPGTHDDPWAAVLLATGDESFVASGRKLTRDEVVRYLTIDPESPNSILSCLRLARENARSVREVISSEMWEQVNRSYLLARDAAANGALLDEPYEFLTEVKLASHLFVGTTYLTMTHNEGWHFGRLGRLLERADQTSRLLEAKQALLVARPGDVGTSLDENHWAALLKSVSALEMYRKRHGQIAPDAVVKFLMLDKKFPRSIRYCLNKGERSLHAITGTPIGSSDTLAERRLGRLNAECEYALVEEIMAEGLELYLDRLQSKLNDLGSAIHETFFAIRPDVEVPKLDGVRAPSTHSDQ